jgi:hypothetical protein
MSDSKRKEQASAEIQKIGYGSPPSRSTLLAWALALTPPLVFLTVLAVRFSVAGAVCSTPAVRLPLELAAGLGLALSAGAGLRARSLLRRTPARGARARSERTLLELGAFLAVLCTIATVFVWLPSWLLPLCHV